MPPEFTKKFTETPLQSQSGSEQVAKKVKGKKQIDIRYTLSLILFFCSLIAVAGVLGAKTWLASEIEKTEQAIAAQEEVIQQRTIRDLLLFEEQIQTFKTLDASRTGYTALLDLFGRIVIPEVRYVSANISLEGETDFVVRIEAIASTLVAYLQQIDVLQKQDGILNKLSVSNYAVRRDSLGRDTVSFSLTLRVPIDALFTTS